MSRAVTSTVPSRVDHDLLRAQRGSHGMSASVDVHLSIVDAPNARIQPGRELHVGLVHCHRQR